MSLAARPKTFANGSNRKSPSGERSSARRGRSLTEHCVDLAGIRQHIDRIDRAIVELLAERGAYVRQAAAFKKDEQEVRAPKRAEEVVLNARRIAVELGGDAAVVERIDRELVAAFTDAELCMHRRV